MVPVVCEVTVDKITNLALLNHSYYLALFSGYFVSFIVLPNLSLRTSPAKTMAVPTHCRVMRALPKKTTEPRIVKNFLVVVMMEHMSGPNSDTVMKMKFCPNAEAKPKVIISGTISGWRRQKEIASQISPVASRDTHITI